MAAAGVRPAQREAGLDGGALLQQHPSGRVAQEDRERAVQPARRPMRDVDGGRTDGHAVLVDELDLVRLAGDCHDGLPVTRDAASLPEISTIGTPTPGCVPEPVNTTFGKVGCRLPGRNGPVCRNVCDDANGVPAAMPWAAQSAGVTTRSTSMPSRKPTYPRCSRVSISSSA